MINTGVLFVIYFNLFFFQMKGLISGTKLNNGLRNLKLRN